MIDTIKLKHKFYYPPFCAYILYLMVKSFYLRSTAFNTQTKLLDKKTTRPNTMIYTI